MIGKALIGNSFYHCIDYCLNKYKTPVILSSFGVHGTDVNQLTQQYEMIAGLRPNVTKKVWHGCVSFAYADEVNDALMVKIAEDYIKELNLDNNQYMVVQHNDTRHRHLHIIVNRIQFDGNITRDYRCGYRTKKVMQKLEKKYGLVQAEKQGNKRKEAIANQIEIGLLNQESIEEIFKRIEIIGFSVVYNKTAKGVIRGVSFRDKEKGINFKSSEISRKYSYSKLLKQTQRQIVKQKNREIPL